MIYQEYFSTRKTSFILPEIVAQMEKAQDQVVRAEYGGKLAITGPAGSGKTTLALHRAAYLLQSPETVDKLDANQIIVFVQDDSTRDYFSHLLPELGINDVEITTMASWARKILPLTGWTILDHERDSDAGYIWSKIKGLKNDIDISWRKNWFNILVDVYAANFSKEQKSRLLIQKRNKILDRVDLAVLLKAIFRTEDGFNIEREYYVVNKKTQEAKRRKTRIKTTYKLVIIDEFQNYLPEHLELFTQAVDPAGGEMVYIGDFNQRVRLGTVNELEDLGELSEERCVKLSKVYRNTKETLVYLKKLGYSVEIPDMIKSGPEVEEMAMSMDEQIRHVEDKISGLGDVSIGILSHNDELLRVFEQRLKHKEKVRVMSLMDAQGVEFDTVFLVGVDDDLLLVEGVSVELRVEMAKIKRDLLYIALTRTMNGLYVLGSKTLISVALAANKDNKTFLVK
ncbi:MAG TPA: AAA family ATPase [bacterium]|nr:AAA family ATPase [bacterium]HPW39441.1 AAA family ATPase [bacterium]HQA63621.1 AAA family ATPase [bacterium]